MHNKDKPKTNQPSGFSRSFARALPFEHAWLRYLTCLWLGLALASATWALLVTQPATDQRLMRSSYLIELEGELEQARANAQHFDLPSLRERADSARRQLHRNAEALDLTILQIIDQLNRLGWKAIVSSVERDTSSSEQLTYTTYQLEFKKDASPPEVSQAETAESEQPLSSDIYAFLETISMSKKQIAIDQLEILTSDGRSAKVFAKLSAAILK
ncbi:hypothetical protein [Pelagicoccus sp. SDUM812002]|uniref:hypothetical protein n=1 Tax=Pelagicoccus sp. SDUM812002 TaxID=3041266 RepID=UPI00280F6C6E|nr:hypothetical protein [Pelagicoccus sp. SDUM812002]MDQ8186473.1 hypothetical protein [Pelagicoccus sp. SDUM812002]